MSLMRFGFLVPLALCVGAVLLSGCYSTQQDTLKVGVPGKDTVTSRYEVPYAQVYEAAKEVLKRDGILLSDDLVTRVLRGRIDDNNVWIKLDDSEPRMTVVTVQARSRGGAPNVELASEVDKRIYGLLIVR